MPATLGILALMYSVPLFALDGTPVRVLRVPGDYETIQAAIDASVDGDEVVIADGVYTGEGNKDLNFGGRAITVRSDNGADGCTIDCQDGGRGFRFANGETFASVLKGITIVNGRGSRIENASPTIEACVFRGNLRSGAIRLLSGAPLIRDCFFVENSNPASDGEGGGGLYSEGAPYVLNCVFDNNFGGSNGGGIFSNGPWIHIQDCAFDRNAALFGGGSSVFIRDGLIVGCTMARSGSIGTGSHIHHDSGDLVLRNCFFTRSQADRGGGLYSKGRSVNLTNCQFFFSNDAPLGGGIYFDAEDTCILTNCTFWNNEAGGLAAGALYVRRGEALVSDSTFSKNYSLPPGIYGGILVHDDATARFTNCILWDNTPREINQGDISYSIVRGGWPGEGNIDADPLFVDAESGDLRLMPGSPAIDSGDNRAVPADQFDLDGDGNTEEPVPFDLDGYGRFVDDPDTDDTGRCDDPCDRPIVDMGAYEFGEAVGACCITDIGDCTDDVPDVDCIDNGGRFEANTLCENLDPPCGSPPCIRDPQWQCDGDVDGDGQVNPVDSGLVQAAFCTGESCTDDALCQYDLDCDGQINPVDSGLVQSLFGTCAAPRDTCP